MTYSKMPLKVSEKWPEQYGFEIAGHGPCFVVNVAKGSVGYNSGLQPGDQILELDGQDVINMSAEALTTLAKHSRTQPPTLGVVSRLLHTELVGTKTMGLGLKVHDSQPVTVKTVEEGGPAQAVGMRTGDIIIETNGRPVLTLDDMKPFLSSHSKRLPLSYIPLGKYVVTPSTSRKVNGRVSQGSRVKRAKDLHDKMNEILGEDYEKKMAVVGVLKQYAEDRDIEMLARALSLILKTPQQRKILRQIRPFIPPKQRIRFDDITRHQQKLMAQERPATTTTTTTTNGKSLKSHKVGRRRALQIVRENGSFGFVIKGSNPAYIETVDTGGPAERAGLQQGDFVIKLNGIDIRKCSHSHLVHMLHDSGTAPIMEVLRCDTADDSYQFGTSGTGSVSTSTSSTSSHAHSDWMTPAHKPIVDKEGRTYADRAEFLLTKKEVSHIRKAMVEYDSTCNIVELFESISQVLDTPSKKTLWMFILARLSVQHQDYCINHVNLPRHVLLEASDGHSGKAHAPIWPMEEDSSSLSGLESTQTERQKANVKLSSFQQQVEYLLTSKERSLLKKALQLYSENRNVEHLLEDLAVILDTPSKRTLWMYIIPLLSHQHQDNVRQRVSNKNSTVSVPAQRKVKGFPPYMSSEDDEHELFSKTGARKMVSKPGHAGTNPMKGVDMALIKELEETRKVVQEARELFTKTKDADHDSTRYITVIPIEHQTTDDSRRTTLNLQIPGRPFFSESSSPLSPVSPLDLLSPHQRAFSPNEPQSPLSQTFSNLTNKNAVTVNKLVGGQDNNRLKMPPNFILGGVEYEPEETGGKPTENYKLSKFSKMGGGTFNRHALTALKQLDAAMAAEVSDLETTDISIISGADDKTSPRTSGDLTLSVPFVPPPAPPPPPAAPPPPPSGSAGLGKEERTQMSVKRINWDKLEKEKVENTIWEQIGEASDLQDVVRYLELEQYFSTKSPRSKIPEKKNEVYVLNPKKSYNISILLGHLKLSLTEVKQALYQMDEDILTPELLRQLLSFAPDKHEMECLDSYSGGIEELSKPDRFTYEMSRVPGYEQRLKALVFKACFKEKIEEMKENLQYIRKASLELRHSRKLAKILELILAMGNYMNQGNQRVGEAAGFKIRFLSQLEITKTSDNKFTFLHVLAEAVYNKFPDALVVGEELTNVTEAAKVSNVLLNHELQDLRKVLQDISNTLEKFGSQKTSIGINDRFQDVMGHFISQASDEIQGLFRLNAGAMEEFQNTVQYFGEDAKKVTTTELFGVFAEFITQFEKAHRHNILNKRHSGFESSAVK